MKVLVTGGAGFIGSRVARQLLQNGHEVTILDNFNPQIHGDGAGLTKDLAGSVQLIRGDVRDEGAWKRALVHQDCVVHLAAETGTGQSMYEICHYAEVNIQGTAILMELLLSGKYSVRSVSIASSRAVYGEGAYLCEEHGVTYPGARSAEAMKMGQFDPRCPVCGSTVSAVPTPENAPLQPMSFYGVTKQVQEQTLLMYASTLGINGFALRYQNVYGPGQSLKNPYTGILAIFSNQARANEPIYVFEDGTESRDFVYIEDVVAATVRSVEAGPSVPLALNVGTGIPVTVSEVVKQICTYFNSHSEIIVNGAFRAGDIRHNYAALDRLKSTLHFVPGWKFEDGVRNFLAWAAAQTPGDRLYERSLVEMRQRGLMHWAN